MGAAAMGTRQDAGRFESQAFTVAGIEVVADRSGTLYLPSERMLLVADLHLEKGSAFARRGVMLPPYDTRETLDRLAAVLARFRPARVVALGDSLHDRGASARLGQAEREAIRRLQLGRDWLWITGNHDPEVSPVLGGEVVPAIVCATLRLCHVPAEGGVAGDCSMGEIAGHLHPAARVALGGTSVRRPCFVGDDRCLVLPAFGAFTGGLNVLDAAVSRLFATERLDVRILGRDGVYPVARASLAPD
ncbi:MAG: ligase-associated DNA damage response endonuclease PdeM [Hyphomicrobiaceae bacterium]